MKVGRYLIVKCPCCGQTQGMETRNFTKAVFKCKYCNRSRKLKLKNTFGFAIKVFWHGDNPTQAQKICTELKKPEEKNEKRHSTKIKN